MKKQDFTVVAEFENRIAEFFGAPYAVAVDCCTHGIELCLRYTEAKYIRSPFRTYLSVPMLAFKLRIPLIWNDINWKDYYWLAPGIVDAAVLWKNNSFNDIAYDDNAYERNEKTIPTFVNLSFQFQKHFNLGRGGMILTDNKEAAIQLKKMSYDGRMPNIPWREQNIDTIGYHYYMTPETARMGLDKLDEAIEAKPRQWVIEDWPDLTKMDVFKNTKNDGSSFGEFKYF